MDSARPPSSYLRLVPDDELAGRSAAPLEGGGGGPHDPGMEARVAKLEAAVEHIQEDVRDIKATLAQLAPVVNRMDGFLQATLPHLATKADVEKRPTAAQITATFGLLIALASLPFWPQWAALFKTVLG